MKAKTRVQVQVDTLKSAYNVEIPLKSPEAKYILMVLDSIGKSIHRFLEANGGENGAIEDSESEVWNGSDE